MRKWNTSKILEVAISGAKLRGNLFLVILVEFMYICHSDTFDLEVFNDILESVGVLVS